MDYIIYVMDLYIQLKCQYPLLTRRIRQYRVDDAPYIDFVITYDDAAIQKMQEKYPYAKKEDIEYMITSQLFYQKILDYQAMLIHSSAICYQEKAYCFSADSGVGKSTHTRLYLQYLPDSFYINDDKPAFRMIDQKFYVYGTPWSGKSDLSINKKVALKGLCFIERGKTNKIVLLKQKEAIPKIIRQTLIINKEEQLDKMLTLVDYLISNYPIYELHCNISKEAFITSYERMSGKKYEN